MAVVSMKQLLEAGVHFGHQTRRWNPKMKPYIFTERNGIYILDLQQALALIESTYDFVRDTVAHGGVLLFVGTKKQAQEAVKENATNAGMPYVNNRWLGGTLTNFETIRKRIARLHQLEEMEANGGFAVLPKKEVIKLRAEAEKLERNLGGIKSMTKLPDAVYIVDPRKERIAVQEALKVGIPIVAIVDTNCDPDEVAFVIPGNDDAIRAIGLITRVMSNAAQEGMQLRAAVLKDEGGPEGKETQGQPAGAEAQKTPPSVAQPPAAAKAAEAPKTPESPEETPAAGETTSEGVSPEAQAESSPGEPGSS